MKQEYQKERKENQKKQSSIKVKLLKLKISKFKQTHLDWQMFWRQFGNKIDRSEVLQISKFSYVKKTLKLKVRILIDGLPLTTE